MTHPTTTSTIRRIRLTFPLVLVWCVFVPMLKIRQFKNTAQLHEDLSDEHSRRILLMQGLQNQDQHRSVTSVKNSSTLFIYIVNTIMPSTAPASASSPLLGWSEVLWDDLIESWNEDTTYKDLLHMATALHYYGDDKTPSATSASLPSSIGPRLVVGGREDTVQTKLILYCLPKTASSTLRLACNIHLRKHCPAIDYPIQQDPYGYRNITEFHRTISECTDMHHFCVQGGSVNMDVFNHDHEEEGSNDGREPYHFVHMIPFRNFREWVESAIKQIFSIDGSCSRINVLLDRCFGYRELYFELYSKSALSLLASMIFHHPNHHEQQQGTRGNDISRMDTHHIVLYNYKDMENIVSQVTDFFHLTPLSLTNLHLKDQSSTNRTCRDRNVISEKFHSCHSDALTNFNYSMSLAEEKWRRKQEMRNMLRLLQRIKVSERRSDA